MSMSSADTQKLTAFLQNTEDTDEPGTPTAAMFRYQSGGIVETLQDPMEKAEGQLDEDRKIETTVIQALL